MPNIICGCGKSVDTKPEWAGQWIACPGCGGTLYAPFPNERVGPPVPVIEILPATAAALPPPPPPAAPVATGTRLCPWCAETIPLTATQCPHCKSTMGEPAARPAPLNPAAAANPESDAWMPLVLGIIGLLLCQFLSPVAWAMGSSYEKKCRREGRSPSGAGTAGRILGIIGTVILFLALMLIAIGAFSS
jgi:hypothetical protein